MYSFEAGQTMMLQEYLADHFAKHLAQREINKLNLQMTDLKYVEFKEKCFGSVIEAETDLKLEMQIEENKQASSSVEKVPVDKTDDETAEDFSCQLCDFVAKNKAGLMAHIRAKHPEVGKVEKVGEVKEETEFEDLNDESTK